MSFVDVPEPRDDKNEKASDARRHAIETERRQKKDEAGQDVPDNAGERPLDKASTAA
ncbi:hypothetical protein OSH11_17430 [Kaistia dalseonensis]|uniref:Uncharacterized protein n=1 Tax=Kaistia dalseonensis TaxID=410840 RepID=A0ABU0H9X1_9HYPH|nr:hypothetical protein [Kaistia dalseonensis]MCX5496492.1 hypothetical protein [Kaistia dalseonensis]MDQ0439114.1 hypothetical protein [Kaistia dalseonensis]